MRENVIIAENKYKQKIVVNPQDHIGKAIIDQGLYDPKGLHYIEQILAKLTDPVVLDIGANIGNHALIMARHSQMVCLFEPQPDVAAMLHQTKLLNNLINWQIFEIGLSDEEKTLSLYKNLEGNNGASTFMPELKSKRFSAEDLKVYVGDEVIQRSAITRVDFIKIDVEGFEAKVINGLKNTIKKFHPIIMLEWNNHFTKKQFEDYDLFNTVFADYLLKTIISSSDKSRWHNKRLGPMRRFFYKRFTRRRYIVGNFVKSFNYQHVLFIPKLRGSLLNEI